MMIDPQFPEHFHAEQRAHDGGTVPAALEREATEAGIRV
jgi:hypothetical protein